MELVEPLKDKQDKVIVLATGTPITKNPEDLISQLKVLGVFHQIWKQDWEFKNRYIEYDHREVKTKNGEWKWIKYPVGYKNLSELNLILKTKANLLRREKEEVLKNLPKKVINEVWVQLDSKTMKQYQRLEEEFEKYVAKLVMEEIAKLGIRPTADEIQDLIFRRANILAKINKLTEFVGKAKIPYAIEWIKNFFEENPNEKLVVFAKHKEVQREIYEAIKNDLGLGVVSVFGDDNPQLRMENVNKFQNDPNIKVIVISIRAGGIGITLTKSHYALFVELDWNLGNMKQAEDRIHRIGQEHTTFIYRMVAKDTIDERILEILETKEYIEQEVIVKTLDVSKILKKIKSAK